MLNIGSMNNIDIRTLAEVIRDAIDPTLKIVYDDLGEGDAGHTGNVSKVEMDHSDE